MMSSMIGIKVADGEFFPILADDVPAKKRLVLTTAHDEQTNVQIDFYKTSVLSLQEAAYIGTLLLENLGKKEKGEPSIEVIVSVNGEGEFFASAYDIDNPADNGNHVLTVSLTPQDETIFKNIDFDEIDIYIDEKNAFTTEYAEVKKGPSAVNPRKLIIIGISLLAALLIAFCLWFFVLKNLRLGGQDEGSVETEESIPTDSLPSPPPEPVFEMPPTEPDTASIAEMPPLPPPPPPPTPPPAPPPQVIEPPLVPAAQQPAARRDRPPAPVSSYKVPAVIPADGVAYKIRWGDTLWDISQAFYRTPWRYSFLAKYNGIRNPDRIVAGRTIRVPPLPN
jgi:LysM repeat protein